MKNSIVNLIVIVGLIAGWKYGVAEFKKFGSTNSSATSIERTVNDQVSSVTDSIKSNLANVNNPFASSTEAKPEVTKNVLTNTVGKLATPTDCPAGGMSCYKDLVKPMPVILADNVTNN